MTPDRYHRWHASAQWVQAAPINSSWHWSSDTTAQDGVCRRPAWPTSEGHPTPEHASEFPAQCNLGALPGIKHTDREVLQPKRVALAFAPGALRTPLTNDRHVICQAGSRKARFPTSSQINDLAADLPAHPSAGQHALINQSMLSRYVAHCWRTDSNLGARCPSSAVAEAVPLVPARSGRIARALHLSHC